MKSKKTFLGVGLLLAILVLGIGYAAITGTNLVISGTATASPNDDNFKVTFDTTATVTTGSYTSKTDGAVTVAGEYTDEYNATITVSGLTNIDDYATATYTIHNESDDLDASLAAAITTGADSSYFDVSYAFKDDATTLAHGSSTTVTVTVKLKKTVIEEKTENVEITITPTAVESK